MTSKSKPNLKLALAAGTLVVVGLAISLYSLGQIYANNKTDGHGNGYILVKSCNEIDFAWKIYECNGRYQAGAGYIVVDDVTVRVTTKSYKAGEYIQDVYPADGRPNHESRKFFTGLERSSVRNNVGWLALVAAGILPLAILLFYAIFARAISHVATEPSPSTK